MKICICGGGNLGHVVAGFVSTQGKYDVCLLTRHPELWSQELTIEAPEGTIYSGHLNGVYSDARQAVADADIVLFCLPGYAIRDTLLQIKDYLRADAAVGTVVSSTGFFFQAFDVLSQEQTLFGFQRVPFISRVVEYGSRARLMGYKDSLELAIERGKTSHKSLKETLQNIDNQIAELHKQRKSTFYASLGLEFFARIVGCLEIYFILNILTHNVSFPNCILIMAFTSLFANIFFFSPMQLGVREGGFAISVDRLSIPGAYGVYTGLLTRVRELVWIIIGVALMKVGTSVHPKEENKTDEKDK